MDKSQVKFKIRNLIYDNRSLKNGGGGVQRDLLDGRNLSWLNNHAYEGEIP